MILRRNIKSGNNNPEVGEYRFDKNFHSVFVSTAAGIQFSVAVIFLSFL